MPRKSDAALPLRLAVRLCEGAGYWNTFGFKKYDIPAFRLSDGPHGLRYRERGGGFDMLGVHPAAPATCFPTAVTLAGAWDERLLSEVGRAIGREALARGVGVVLGPGLNLKRSPLGGRNFEYFSEDPLLSGKLAAAFIRGLQSTGAAACPKHFAANSQERERFSSDSVLDERSLRELYLLDGDGEKFSFIRLGADFYAEGGSFEISGSFAAPVDAQDITALVFRGERIELG